MERKSRYLPIVIFILSACSPKGFQEPLATIENAKTEPTAKIEQPYYSYKLGSKASMVEGLVQSNDLKLNLDGKTTETTVKGNVTVRFIGGGQATIPVDVAGKIEEEPVDGAVGFLKSVNSDALASQNVRVGAKITCLSDNCADSFIDIYIAKDAYVYHHQVQAHKNAIPDFSQSNYPQQNDDDGTDVESDTNTGTDTSAETPAPSTEPAQPEPKKGSGKGYEKDKTPTPTKKPKQPKKIVNEDDGSQFEHGDGVEANSENGGLYVGRPVQDVEVIFPDLVDPKPVVPKKDGTKSDSKGGKSDTKKDDTKDDGKSDDKDSKKDDQKSDSESDSQDTGVVGTIVRKVNQAVTAMVNRNGRPNFTIGRLENATNIYSYQLKVADAGFRFVYPKRATYFGTDDMLAALVSIGQFNKAHVNGYVNNVGDVSREKGGQLGSHSSHQMGIDADISYYFDDASKQKGLDEAVVSSKPVKSFMEEEQWEMFKSLTEKNIVTFIFVDSVIKKDLCQLAARKGEVKPGDTTSVAFKTLRLLNTSAPGHDDHFHLRLKCSQAQPRCRQQPLPTGSSTGC